MDKEYDEWNKNFQKVIKKENVKKAVDGFKSKEVPAKLYTEIRNIVAGKAEATRATSGRSMQVIAKYMEGFVGGSADLAPSNKTFINGSASITREDFTGKNLHFGIREHAMGAIVNGMSLHGNLIPYASTFLIFSDYMRPSIRLSSLMKRQVVYVFTHDSIYVGEDGPTHQPIEQISSLRLIPGLRVLRPCGELETIEAWLMTLERNDGPTALVLTRQNLDQINVENKLVQVGIRKGAYVVSAESGKLKAVLLASGSEVPLALKVREKLNAESWMRIVSVPCMELFMEQDQKYIDSIMPKDISRISVEAGNTRLWKALCGNDSLNIGIDDFAASAPGGIVAKYKGMDIDSVAEKIRLYLKLD